jgi:hypothetical protein
MINHNLKGHYRKLVNLRGQYRKLVNLRGQKP